jgi:hypothetical protein
MQIAALVTAANVFLYAAPALAQDASSARVLSGHCFIPSTLAPAPFAISFFRTGTGGGLALDVETPFLGLDGDTVGVVVGDIGFLDMSFEYQQRFLERFAVSAALGGSARLGVDEHSALSEGVTGAVLLHFGVLGELFRTEHAILSATADVGQSEFVGLHPLEFAQSVVDSGLVDDNDLVSKSNTVAAAVGLRSAWAPTAYLGLVGTLKIGAADTPSGDWGDTFIGGSAALSVDLRALLDVPIGFLASGESEGCTHVGADLSSRSKAMGLGLFYTGWDDFSIGIETIDRTLERRADDSQFRSVVGRFQLRYYPRSSRDDL